MHRPPGLQPIMSKTRLDDEDPDGPEVPEPNGPDKEEPGDNKTLSSPINEPGQSYEKVAKDTDRNYWLGAEEAIEYGLVEKVIENATELDA